MINAKCISVVFRSSLLIESLYEYSYGYYYNYGYDSSKKACHDYENEDGIDQYEYYYGSSTSDDSQEHIYWEIPDIQVTIL